MTSQLCISWQQSFIYTYNYIHKYFLVHLLVAWIIYLQDIPNISKYFYDSYKIKYTKKDIELTSDNFFCWIRIIFKFNLSTSSTKYYYYFYYKQNMKLSIVIYIYICCTQLSNSEVLLRSFWRHYAQVSSKLQGRVERLI